jgi:sarcosine oxidase subunit gamma
MSKASASMAETMTTLRRPPLAAPASTLGGITIAPEAPRTRLILRGEAACALAGSVLGLLIPRQPNRAATTGDRAALWLGPDEWLILAPETETHSLFQTLEQALASVPHALVDVSHRQTGIIVSGAGVEALLNAFVPLELTEAAFPVVMATRTIFEKAEIVLWRTGPERFHLETWRSLAPYVRDLLEVVAKENAAG